MRSARRQRARRAPSGQSVVVDRFMDLYLAWRESAGDVETIYSRWSRATSPADRRSAFEAFSRALAQEEGAALQFGQFAGYAARTLSA